MPKTTPTTPPPRHGVTHASAMWRRLDVHGLEHFRFRLESAGPRLSGTVLLADPGGPLRLDYDITCDAGWSTRSAGVTLVRDTVTRRLSLSVDGRGRWKVDGEEAEALRGCVDVDVSLTPSTNMLPIRRLGLGVGESREVTAAWVRLPELVVEPLPQRYTRLDERHYRYESRGGSFVAELEVDEAGVVVKYPPFWERVAAGG
ncbi:MAG TPA: putative glycolipid-binding domain-containing protein [Gemmatimonadaceae bacterium]|nr:putative glycolipid-binding domain-containing protein [Gemmatimonadaceae bacterium]